MTLAMATFDWDTGAGAADAHIDDELTPAPVFNRDLEGHSVFDLPILVVAGPPTFPLAFTLWE